jgi:hypothetical protein
MALVSLAHYARTRGIDESAIRQQIRKGVIKRIHGLIDEAQADEAWAAIRRAQMAAQNDDGGRRSAHAKIVGAVADLRLDKDRFEARRERYVDRAEAIRQGTEDVQAFLRALRQIPERRAEMVAARLGISPVRAALLLQTFVNQAITELGDLRADATRAAEAA